MRGGDARRSAGSRDELCASPGARHHALSRGGGRRASLVACDTLCMKHERFRRRAERRAAVMFAGTDNVAEARRLVAEEERERRAAAEADPVWQEVDRLRRRNVERLRRLTEH